MLRKTNYTLTSGTHDTIGRRETMEDTHVAIDQRVSESPSLHQKVAYYGCFDGHGGTDTAILIEKILHEKVFQRQEFGDGHYIQALEKAFEEADKIVVAESIEKNYMNGCTAVVGVVVDGVLYIANIGDSEGILISVENDKVFAENLTFPHKASVASEKFRIESLGGYVFFNRVFGSLAVTRAFGDSKYKQPKTTQNFVSIEPATKTIPLTKCHRYILFACDGLWDVCTHDEVANIVHQQFQGGKNEKEIAQHLCTEAVRKKSDDNVTVVLVKINWEEETNSNNNLNVNETKLETENPRTEDTKPEGTSKLEST